MKHFTFELFAISNTASSRGINNSVPVNYKSHAEELVNTILDPLTDAWGSKIRMTSGFRCKRLNDVIGGALNSAHSYAYAADLVPENGRTLDFKNFTIQWLLNNNIKFDLFIDEYKGNSSWVHISVRNGFNKLRQQWLKFYDNKYTSIDPRVYKAGDMPNNVGNSGNNSLYNEGGYSSGGSSSEGEDTRQYNNINVTQIRTGSSTQTGNTEGLLQGKSVYLKDRDIVGILNNDVYVKDENGLPLFDENGDLLITDDYLFGANESVSDGIESIDELGKEPFDFDMSKATLDDVELVQGLQFNADGSYIVRQSKTVQEIIAIVLKWWELVQSLLRIDFKNIQESIKKYDEEQENMKAPSINAMVYMKAAFDMYGHAFREGMVCPVCGKKARYLPPGGYCSVECLLKAAKDKSLAFLMVPNQKYAWLQDIINLLCAVLDLTNLLINAVVLIPDIIRELALLPPEYKEYVQNKIAEGFLILQELIQEAMVKKNELLERILKPMNFGIIAKPVAMAMQTIELIRSALTIALDAFNMAYDIVKLILSNLSLPNVTPGLVLPAESFAWSLTPRSFICPMYPTPVNSDMGKIFVNLPGGWGVPILGLKPLLPSALLNINMQAIDLTILGLFPPLTPLDYYLEPELFEIRFLFSDQSDLVFLIRQQLEDLLVGGPDYLPKFENLLPVKEFTFGKGSPNELHIWLPNLGYVWFLLGLMDAWAPHSKALVGSILNPLL